MDMYIQVQCTAETLDQGLCAGPDAIDNLPITPDRNYFVRFYEPKQSYYRAANGRCLERSLLSKAPDALYAANPRLHATGCAGAGTGMFCPKNIVSAP